jgi:hypothetical protein
MGLAQANERVSGTIRVNDSERALVPLHRKVEHQAG